MLFVRSSTSVSLLPFTLESSYRSLNRSLIKFAAASVSASASAPVSSLASASAFRSPFQSYFHSHSFSPIMSQSTSSSSSTKTFTLETLPFDNLVHRSLPIDKSLLSHPRSVPNACFSLVHPTPLDRPQLVSASPSALKLLGLNEEEMKRPEFVEYFSGNKPFPGSQTAAHCYCGHQFGYFSGQLGDGAAMYIGEVRNEAIEPSGRIELQFKGAGMTPYSRQADGRKVLRSSIREYLCSELMAGLGVPTTRAATCITSETKVVRDMFYTGNNMLERATVITRLAQSFIRFGSFEIFKATDPTTGRAGPSVGRIDILQQLLDYVVNTFYPSIANEHSDSTARYAAFFEEVVRRTAYLISCWQCVGWEHGVMNTDNMSILGVTIDYGPFGFLDRYDPDYISNTSDEQGRYTYGKQAEIAKWNLLKLAEALQPILPLSVSKPLVEKWDEYYKHEFYSQMKLKLGLVCNNSDKSMTFAARAVRESSRSGSSGVNTAGAEPATDKEIELIHSLLSLMYESGADFTNTFRALSKVQIPSSSSSTSSSSSSSTSDSPSSTASSTIILSLNSSALDLIVRQCACLSRLVDSYSPRVPPQQLQILVMLAQRDPALLDQLGASAEMIRGELDRDKKRRELQKMSEKERDQQNRQAWEQWIVKYVEALDACRKKALQSYPSSFSSSSSPSSSDWHVNRVSIQDACNPKFILRNWIAQAAIEKAEAGDYSEVNKLLLIFSDPYVQNEEIQSNIRQAFSAQQKEKEKEKEKQQEKETDKESDTEAVATCSIVSARADRIQHAYTLDEYASLPPDWSTQVKVSCSS